MQKFKKTIAVLCSALMLIQGAVGFNFSGSKAQAIDTVSGPNYQLMTQNGLNSNSYFWKKAIWNRTTSNFAKDVVSRPYPRLVGNQWNILQNGNENNGDTGKYQEYAAKYFDFIYLNRVQGAYSDKFVDTFDSTHNPNMGLLKYRNGVYAIANAAGRRCYVLPYHAQEGVENYSPPSSGYNYWFHDNSDNPWKTSENSSTWDLVNAHNGWYRNGDGSYVQYGSYSTSLRRVFDQRNAEMRTYWAGHAYQTSMGDSSTQFDGIFADNWLRSNGPDSSGWQKGVNQAASLLKSKWGSDKILVGNGLYISTYNARDFGMIEDYSGNMRWDFSLSDQFAGANQLAIDSSASPRWGTLWNRLARNLMTDDVFGIHDDENGGVVPFVDNYISKLGKIGYPLEDRVNLGNSAYMRKFTNGIAYWNNSGGNYTVSVPAGLYKDINNVNVEGNVTLANQAGLILKTRNGGSTNPPPTEPPTDPPASNVPAAPSNLTVTSVTKGATSGNVYVNLSWKDNSTNETGFELYQSVNSTNNFQLIKSPAANGTGYGVNIGASPTSGTYYYKVLAVNADGKSQPSNVISTQISSGVPQNPVPAAPTNLVLGIPGGHATPYVKTKDVTYYDAAGKSYVKTVTVIQLPMSWRVPSPNTAQSESVFMKVDNVDKWNQWAEVKVDRSPVGDNWDLHLTELLNPSFALPHEPKWGEEPGRMGQEPVSNYSFKVRYKNANGVSEFSNVMTVSIDPKPIYGPLLPNVPAAPSNLAVTSVTKGATSGNIYINLSWKDNADNETGFELYQSVNSTNNFQLIKTPVANGTGYGVNIGSNPVKGTYYYKIVAVNKDGKSQESNIISTIIK